ncbi:hypothetical protein [Streptomyces rubrogriseus]|uniref:hypothetical protein n=1 Tax=Streptomyces rubrogriseus TaxID=194673 RepID=UPI00131EFED1|nr:hypothetical protein [Streptomyces rubrogriseus]
MQPALISLFILAAFIACYIGLQRDPKPHGLPVAAVGRSLAAGLEGGLGDQVSVQTATSNGSAQAALERRDVVAVVGGDDRRLHLEVAGANGVSTTVAVEQAVKSYAARAGAQLTIHDAVPLVAFDRKGTAGFYVVFGVSLAGFVFAQMTLGVVRLLASVHQLVMVAVFSAASGLVAAAVAGPALGAVPAPVLPLTCALALLTAATASATVMLCTYLGTFGIPVATLLLLTVGISTSGATTGVDLLPLIARSISPCLPPGAAFRAVTDFSYFEGAHAAGSLIVLAVWAVLATALTFAHPFVRQLRRRIFHLSAGRNASH